MRRNSAGRSSQSHFSNIPSVNIQRSTFDRSHMEKTTFNEGLLIPIFVDEVLPGDTFKLRMSHVTRLATPIFPYMDNVYLDFHFFFVPNRIVWENWERFNGAQDNPGDSTDFLVPSMTAPTSSPVGFEENSVMDYMGIPTKRATLKIDNSLPFRAYHKIYNDWYRDENTQGSAYLDIGDGPDLYGDYGAVLAATKRKDYFTSALPWTQKGPSVMLPLGTTAPIIGGDAAGNFAPMKLQAQGTGATFDLFYNQASVKFQPSSGSLGSDQTVGADVGAPMGMHVDLTDATAATINQLREAATLQQLFERDARGGTRYIEILLSHFGVVSPDFRLQRAEYLGGGSSPINVNPIAQTSETTDDSPQGNLAAFAMSSKTGIGFNHSFVEHGHVIGIVRARADMTYQQGLNKMWSRSTRYDFYWPTFAHLGEQAVLNKEIYAYSSDTINEQVFGYQERYAEYRYKPSMVTAQFRSNATLPLDAWHLAYDFDSLPVLSAEFMVEAPPIDRIVEVPTQPHFISDFYFNLKCTRPMPVYSVPGLNRL